MIPVCRHCQGNIEYWLWWLHTDTMQAACHPAFGDHEAAPTILGGRTTDPSPSKGHTP